MPDRTGFVDTVQPGARLVNAVGSRETPVENPNGVITTTALQILLVSHLP